MDGMGNSLGDGPSPTYNSPRRTTGQHDLLIVLDIPDHSYIDGLFKTEIEQMATKAKLVRCHGRGFNNEGRSARNIGLSALSGTKLEPDCCILVS